MAKQGIRAKNCDNAFAIVVVGFGMHILIIAAAGMGEEKSLKTLTIEAIRRKAVPTRASSLLTRMHRLILV